MAKELFIGIAIGAALKSSFNVAFSSAEKNIAKLSSALNSAQIKNQHLSDKITASQKKQGNLWAKIYQAHKTGDSNLTHLQSRYANIKKQIAKIKKEQQSYTKAINQSVGAQTKLQQAFDKRAKHKTYRNEQKGLFLKSAGATYAGAASIWSNVKNFIDQENAANDLKIAMMKADFLSRLCGG